MTIDRSDIADGDWDGDLTLMEVHTDIRQNFDCYTVCYHPDGGLEIGHADEELSKDEPPIVATLPSEIYSWMQY